MGCLCDNLDSCCTNILFCGKSDESTECRVKLHKVGQTHVKKGKY